MEYKTCHVLIAQILHRDIKPANIMLMANDVVKIGDLGVAKVSFKKQRNYPNTIRILKHF